MSKAPAGIERTHLNTAARQVLLDGLEALAAHIDAVTVVGAQAVYLRSETAAITAAGYTSDGDLGIDPDRLGDDPLLEDALRQAGFEPMSSSQPGLWAKPRSFGGLVVPIELDLLVGSTLASGGRGARIPPHSKMAARIVPGLDVCAVDRSPMLITALDSADTRQVAVNVAGPAALMVAKSYKLAERLTGGRPERIQDKDAGDVLRLMMTSRAARVAESFATLVADHRVGTVAIEGLRQVKALFGGARAPGVEMAVRALAGDVPERQVRALAPAFVNRMPAPP